MGNPWEFMGHVKLLQKLSEGTLPETNIAPESRPKPNRKVVFQPSILLVSGRVTLQVDDLFFLIILFTRHGFFS